MWYAKLTFFKWEVKALNYLNIRTTREQTMRVTRYGTQKKMRVWILQLEQRQRSIQAFEDVSEDYLTVAATIGVNRSTARGIVARYLREVRIAERPREGANHVRVDYEMRNCLHDIINDNCLLTLAPAIHDRTVARTLEGMLYRVKLARTLPADRNRPDVLQKGVDYANWFMRHAVVKVYL